MTSRDVGPGDDYGDLRWHGDRTGFGDLIHLAAHPQMDPLCFQLLCLLRLHEHRSLGVAWPSRKRLRDLMGLKDVETVDKHLRHLRGLNDEGEENPKRPNLLLFYSRQYLGRPNQYKSVAPEEAVRQAKDRIYRPTTKSSDKTDGRPIGSDTGGAIESDTRVSGEIEGEEPTESDTRVSGEIGGDREVGDSEVDREVGKRGRDCEVGAGTHGAAPRGPRPEQNDNDDVGSPAEHPPPGEPGGAHRREAALEDAADRYWDGEPVDE